MTDNSRPYVCSFCDRGFRKSEHLQRHRRTHTKEKPYKCECGQAFARQDLLRRHERVSHRHLDDALSGACGTTRLPRRPSGCSSPGDPVSLTRSSQEPLAETSAIGAPYDKSPDAVPNTASGSSLDRALPLPPEYQNLGR
ncbi:Putative Zinc finger C2H2-type [Colletotrichum destructivum]|uniref:Zinc finger C2H2-type n=1 Tax=Colletotrichum destructivum TaxID=34406 RepID=A0AAX4HWE6_9PEZI|nr:Putative Zinc finger C2H2-type [Colletotrichum destructivum]